MRFCRTVKTFIYISIFCSLSAFGQNDILVDKRDGQKYRITEISGLKWMLDDLNYFTEWSFDLSKEDRGKYNVPPARWYHLTEIDSVCPDGWRLPTGDEWLAYIKMQLDEQAKYSEGTYKSDYAIWNIKDDLDLYESGNPLSLQVMGIFEGDQFFQHSGSADYWIQDIPEISEVGKNSGLRAVKKTYPNRSHVHLYPDRTNFHSHKHHLDMDDSTTMRRFLVRCVCEI